MAPYFLCSICVWDLSGPEFNREVSIWINSSVRMVKVAYIFVFPDKIHSACVCVIVLRY